MRLRDIDLNLLVVFNQMLMDRSASTAAEKLNMSQPAVIRQKVAPHGNMGDGSDQPFGPIRIVCCRPADRAEAARRSSGGRRATRIICHWTASNTPIRRRKSGADGGESWPLASIRARRRGECLAQGARRAFICHVGPGML